LIDSPGTFEIQASTADFKKRSNEKICELIIECLKHEVTYLNMVVLFLPISSRVDDKDIKSIDLFVKMFKNHNANSILTPGNYDLNINIEELKLKITEIKDKTNGLSTSETELLEIKIKEFEKQKRLPMLLCLSHADKYNEVKRNIALKEIKEHPDLINYFQNRDIEIVFMGCVDHKFQDYTDEYVMSDSYELVFEWRRIFLALIFSSSDRVDLRNTNIYFNNKEDVGKLLKICLDTLNHLSIINFDSSEYKFKLEEHKINMTLLYKNKMLIYEDNKHSKQFDEL